MATPDDDLMDEELERSVRAALHGAVGEARPPRDGWTRLEARMRRHRAERRVRFRLVAMAAAALSFVVAVVGGAALFAQLADPQPRDRVDLAQVDLDQYPEGPLWVRMDVAAADADALLNALHRRAAAEGWEVRAADIPMQSPFVDGTAVHLTRDQLPQALLMLDEIAVLEEMAVASLPDATGPSVLVVYVRPASH